MLILLSVLVPTFSQALRSGPSLSMADMSELCVSGGHAPLAVTSTSVDAAGHSTSPDSPAAANDMQCPCCMTVSAGFTLRVVTIFLGLITASAPLPIAQPLVLPRSQAIRSPALSRAPPTQLPSLF